MPYGRPVTGAVSAGGPDHPPAEEVGSAAPPSATALPFSVGSVSLRLYPHNDLAASGIVAELVPRPGWPWSPGSQG